jgi:uncharacterized membrane protein
MYSELIIVISTGQEDTDKVWRTLESRQCGKLLTMSDVVLIRRDSQGKSTFQIRWRASDHLDNHHGRLAAVFAESIFGFSRAEGLRRLAEAGVDKLFLQEVVEALQPGCSAYLIYVPRESLIDTGRYLEILEALPGNLYHTTFRHQTEEALLKQKG